MKMFFLGALCPWSPEEAEMGLPDLQPGWWAEENAVSVLKTNLDAVSHQLPLLYPTSITLVLKTPGPSLKNHDSDYGTISLGLN